MAQVEREHEQARMLRQAAWDGEGADYSMSDVERECCKGTLKSAAEGPQVGADASWCSCAAPCALQWRHASRHRPHLLPCLARLKSALCQHPSAGPLRVLVCRRSLSLMARERVSVRVGSPRNAGAQATREPQAIGNWCCANRSAACPCLPYRL